MRNIQTPHVSDPYNCATLRLHNYTDRLLSLLEMAKLLLLLVGVCAVLRVGDFAGILRKQFLQEPVYVKGEADPGQPLFLTPYVKKKDYRTGNCFNC